MSIGILKTRALLSEQQLDYCIFITQKGLTSIGRAKNQLRGINSSQGRYWESTIQAVKRNC